MKLKLYMCLTPLKVHTCMQDDRPQLSCKRKSCFSSSILYYMHGVGSGGSILYSYLYNLQDSSRAKVSFGEMVYIVLLLRTIIAQASTYITGSKPFLSYWTFLQIHAMSQLLWQYRTIEKREIKRDFIKIIVPLWHLLSSCPRTENDFPL